MKIVKFSSESSAKAEADRLITALGYPEGLIYGEPRQTHDGIWFLYVKENGSWPATDVIQGTIEDYEWPGDVL